MSVKTRHRKEHEDMQKQLWRSKLDHHREVCRNTTNPFKRRTLKRPPLIIFKELPEYKYENCFMLPVNYFLETALLFMINAENIQTWFFEEEFRGYFIADFTLEESTRHLLLRLMDRTRHPDIEREPVVDDFLDSITDVTYYFEYDPSDYPDTVLFALYILSLEGPIEERLQLHKDLHDIEKFINSVLGKKVFAHEEDEDEEVSAESSYQDEVESPLPMGGGWGRKIYSQSESQEDAESSYQDDADPPSQDDVESPSQDDAESPPPMGGGWGRKIYSRAFASETQDEVESQDMAKRTPEIINLIDEEDRDLKRKYDEIIDLTVSDDDDE